ncbi:unnamed protein product [Closterium sp. NIES-53]
MASIATTALTPTARLAATPSASAASDASSAGATPLLPLRSGSSGRPLSRQSAALSAPTPGEFAQPSSASARGRRGAVLVRAESAETKGAREETQPGAAASAYSDSEGEDASAPRLTVAQKLQLQMSSPTSLPDGTTIPLPIGGRRRVLSASYPLAAWTPAQKRNLARATLLNKVGERNDSPLFATIGALVLGPPVVILAVAFFSGYCDSRDGVSLLDLTSGVSTALAATADSTVRLQWTTRDAVACLAVRRHLPSAERAHFGQYKTAQSMYDAVVARYSSPSTAALSRLMLPYLFPDLAAFATVADLITHLRTSDTRYRVALPTEFCTKNPPPMYITLYYLVTRCWAENFSLRIFAENRLVGARVAQRKT